MHALVYTSEPLDEGYLWLAARPRAGSRRSSFLRHTSCRLVASQATTRLSADEETIRAAGSSPSSGPATSFRCRTCGREINNYGSLTSCRCRTVHDKIGAHVSQRINTAGQTALHVLKKQHHGSTIAAEIGVLASLSCACTPTVAGTCGLSADVRVLVKGCQRYSAPPMSPPTSCSPVLSGSGQASRHETLYFLLPSSVRTICRQEQDGCESTRR